MMSNTKFQNRNELTKFLNIKTDSSISVILETFLEKQKQSWELLNNNINDLKTVQIRECIVDDFKIQIQHISHRIKSTTALVDKNSIEKRACFLCKNNLPPEQKGFLLLDKYVLLSNPYPIFDNHFTLALINHEPQRIREHITDMINLSREFGEEHLLLYNGPNCGASAPDHFHFQVCRQADLPLTRFIRSSEDKYFQLPGEEKDISEFVNFNFPIPHIVLKSEDSEKLRTSFDKWYEKFHSLTPADEESKINLLSFYYSQNYYLVIFPREKHRPDCYFEEGKKSMLISPAAIDLSGVLIVPRYEDFIKITDLEILKIFQEVTIPLDVIKKLAGIKAF